MASASFATSQMRTFPEFLVQVVQLKSVPLLVLYMAIIPASRLWRRSTKPVEMKSILVVYNFICSSLSAYTFIKFLIHILNADSLYSRKYDADLVHTLQYYWYAKALELLDTVFMILRHRQRQISFLHVFHHATMLILGEYGYRITPRTSFASFLAINSFIHVVLYLYYGLAALNPGNPPQWKKLLTQLQILQFLVALVIGTYGYLYHTFCIYGIFYAFSMLVLFSNFYYKAYLSGKSKKAEKKA